MDSSSETSFNLKVFQLVEGSTGPSQLLDSRQIEFEEEGNMIINFRVLTHRNSLLFLTLCVGGAFIPKNSYIRSGHASWTLKNVFLEARLN